MKYTMCYKLVIIPPSLDVKYLSALPSCSLKSLKSFRYNICVAPSYLVDTLQEAAGIHGPLRTMCAAISLKTSP